MTPVDALVVDTVELRRQTGTRRNLRTTAHLSEMAVGDRGVLDGVLDLDLVIEAVTEGVVAKGRAQGRWTGPCRRCLAPVEGDLEIDLHEIFERSPVEGETWPLTDDGIDLAPVLREAALLALPLAPLCRDDCEGPEPERFPTGVADEAGDTALDPRWAALDELSFDDEVG